MPTTIDDLAASLRQFFADRFPLEGEGGPGSVLLVFDSLGTPLQPSEFAGSGTAAAVDLLAHQRAAQLADQLPARNALGRGWYLPRSGSRLSRWYSVLLQDSTSVPTGEAELAAFESAKRQAARMLEANRLVTVSGTTVGGSGGTVPAAGTMDSYFATSMSPLDWFSEAATCWGTYSVKASDEPPPPDDQTLGPAELPPFEFRTIEVPPGGVVDPVVLEYVQNAAVGEPVAEVVANAVTQPVVETVAIDWRPPFEVPAEVAARVGAGAPADVAEPVGAGAPADVAEQVGAVAAVDVVEPVGEVVTADVMERAAVELAHDAVEVPVERLQVLETAMGGQAGSAPELLRAGVQPLVAWDPSDVLTGTSVKPPTSKGFEVSFEYCLVRFDRPWWDDVFLSRRGWRVSGYDPGQISSGSAADPTGDVTLITVGMVVIRKLAISATWSDDDQAALRRSTSLGPFCIAGGSFDASSGTLTRNGTQAVAWLCQVPQVLPPAVL